MRKIKWQQQNFSWSVWKLELLRVEVSKCHNSQVASVFWNQQTRLKPIPYISPNTSGIPRIVRISKPLNPNFSRFRCFTARNEKPRWDDTNARSRKPKSISKRTEEGSNCVERRSRSEGAKGFGNRVLEIGSEGFERFGLGFFQILTSRSKLLDDMRSYFDTLPSTAGK